MSDPAPDPIPLDQAAPRPRRCSRRRMLQLGAAGVISAGLAGWRVTGYPEPPVQLTHFSPSQTTILAAILSTLLPPEADRSPEGLADHLAFIDGYLQAIPEPDREQLTDCLYLFEHATWLDLAPWRFTRLDPADQVRVLEGWQTSRIGLRRLGFRSLKAMAFLAYYRTAEAFGRIGYPGPIAPGHQGLPQSRARYDPLLARPGREPAWP